jgi:predicted O-methyltransferase YrrM
LGRGCLYISVAFATMCTIAAVRNQPLASWVGLSSSTPTHGISWAGVCGLECQTGQVESAHAVGPQDPLETVRAVRKRLIRDGRAVARSDGSVHHLFPIGVAPAEGAAIRSWVIREAAADTIEIGLGYAISALFVCEGLLSNGVDGGRHVVIDPNQETRFASCGLQFLTQAGVDRLVEYRAEESQTVLPRLVSEGRKFDMAVVDGNHRFDAVFVDLYYLARLLRPGAIVFIDDYHLRGIAKAVAFFLTNLRWSLEEVSTAEHHHHWAVLRTPSEPDTRHFEYFVEF